MPDISLTRFMIFNSSEGQHESQEGDKLLYHWTKDSNVSRTEKINDVCLCDASVNVGHRLGQNKCDTRAKEQKLVLYFEQTVIIILELEPKQSIWMAVHILSNSQQDNDFAIGGNNIPVGAIERIMRNIYERFCLLNGTFRMIAEHACISSKEKNDVSTIIRAQTRTICEDYFNSILPDIHLGSMLTNVASLYNHIVYLDLSPLVLMRVNSFINHLVCINADQILHTILLFNDQLIWSSLNLENTRVLYGYMVSVLIRKALQEELSREVSKVRKIRESMPLFMRDESTPEEPGLIKLYLTVFRSRNMTLGLIMNELDLENLVEKCEKILTSDSRLGVIPLASLAQSVGQNYLKASQQQQHHQPNNNPSGSASSQAVAAAAEYISLDHIDASIAWPLNLDKEHHIQPDSLGHEGQSRKSRLIRYLTELESEFCDIEQELGCQMEEFFARTLSDSWLMATNSNYKTIYSLHHSRNSSLSEAQQSAYSLKINLSRSKP